MTDNPAIEAMARAIMIARPNGGCIVSDWQKEAVDNPHVSTALAQAQAAYDALAAAGFAVVPVEPTEAQIQAMCGAIESATPMYVGDAQDFRGECWTNEAKAAYRAMIAAATPPTT